MKGEKSRANCAEKQRGTRKPRKGLRQGNLPSSSIDVTLKLCPMDPRRNRGRRPARMTSFILFGTRRSHFAAEADGFRVDTPGLTR